MSHSITILNGADFSIAGILIGSKIGFFKRVFAVGRKYGLN